MIYEIIIFGSVIAFTTAMTFVEFRRLRKNLEADRHNEGDRANQHVDQTAPKS